MLIISSYLDCQTCQSPTRESIDRLTIHISPLTIFRLTTDHRTDQLPSDRSDHLPPLRTAGRTATATPAAAVSRSPGNTARAAAAARCQITPALPAALLERAPRTACRSLHRRRIPAPVAPPNLGYFITDPFDIFCKKTISLLSGQVRSSGQVT